MRILYTFAIYCYQLAVYVMSFSNKKAKKWLDGRKDIFGKMQSVINLNDKILWFHAASVGEFEQGRPIIEEIKKNYCEYKVLLTFFSPSGYELRKNYPFADYVFYLPLDTPQNVKKFIQICNPQMAFFIKYEFWYNYLRELRKKEIPTYIFSAIFRPSQIFFKPWGSWFLRGLYTYKHIFVQNESSAELLKRFELTNVTVSGDTRLDRVFQIADSSPILSVLEQFVQNKKIIVAGSTWVEDEISLIKFINQSSYDLKFAIAPHEVHDHSIHRITSKLKKPYVLYSSNATKDELEEARVLIIDGYGYLVSVYRYAQIAYIGGGFGSGIHSTLEPAAYGMPIIFGPKYQKFKEAVELIRLGSAHSINNYEDLKKIFDDYLTNTSLIQKDSQITLQYIKQNKGASADIIKHIFADQNI